MLFYRLKNGSYVILPMKIRGTSSKHLEVQNLSVYQELMFMITFTIITSTKPKLVKQKIYHQNKSDYWESCIKLSNISTIIIGID